MYPHPIESDAHLDGRCAGRLFHHHNIDRRSIICLTNNEQNENNEAACEYNDDCNQIHVGSENKKCGEGSLLDVHRDIKTYLDQLFGDRQREKMACALLLRLS